MPWTVAYNKTFGQPSPKLHAKDTHSSSARGIVAKTHDDPASMRIHTSETSRHLSRRYGAEVARSPDDVRLAQSLRYKVFAEELGANLKSAEEGIDRDEIDEFCDHLLVRDLLTGKVAACTRLLTDTQARRLGYYYSETEFHIGGVLSLPGRHLEIGRTCVDPQHRGSLVLATLWGGLAQYVSNSGFDYLMGCASIPPGPEGFEVDAIYQQIRQDQLGPAHLGVRPRIEVPLERRSEGQRNALPPLLQAYLRLGCWILGDPSWDADFNVMDVFILLKLEHIQARYERRFISTANNGKHDLAQSIA